jgi:hypothetical protein
MWTKLVEGMRNNGKKAVALHRKVRACIGEDGMADWVVVVGLVVVLAGALVVVGMVVSAL